jgi:hypothetical protein
VRHVFRITAALCAASTRRFIAFFAHRMTWSFAQTRLPGNAWHQHTTRCSHPKSWRVEEDRRRSPEVEKISGWRQTHGHCRSSFIRAGVKTADLVRCLRLNDVIESVALSKPPIGNQPIGDSFAVKKLYLIYAQKSLASLPWNSRPGRECTSEPSHP